MDTALRNTRCYGAFTHQHTTGMVCAGNCNALVALSVSAPMAHTLELKGCNQLAQLELNVG